MPTPYQTLSWLGGLALCSHKTNNSCRLGLEQGLNTQVCTLKYICSYYYTYSLSVVPSIRFSHIKLFTVCVQAPDWNEEMQTARDLPQTNLEERLQREKALLQVHTL